MPRFLAVYIMHADNVARFRALPKAEQDAIDAAGVPQWLAWEARTGASIVERGGMVGKTLRASPAGIGPAVNTICGYVVVEAETHEAAARLFEGHPHFSVFPGDWVDVMPFVTEPA